MRPTIRHTRSTRILLAVIPESYHSLCQSADGLPMPPRRAGRARGRITWGSVTQRGTKRSRHWRSSFRPSSTRWDTATRSAGSIPSRGRLLDRDHGQVHEERRIEPKRIDQEGRFGCLSQGGAGRLEAGTERSPHAQRFGVPGVLSRRHTSSPSWAWRDMCSSSTATTPCSRSDRSGTARVRVERSRCGAGSSWHSGPLSL